MRVSINTSLIYTEIYPIHFVLYLGSCNTLNMYQVRRLVNLFNASKRADTEKS